jgi:uncharacterized caspase-like protein
LLIISRILLKFTFRIFKSAQLHKNCQTTSFIILSASSAGETSREGKQWGGGHGVFTYYLLEGLKGAADTNKNGLVDIKETYEYIRTHVSSDTKEKQFPLLNGRYSKSFPMGAVMK